MDARDAPLTILQVAGHGDLMVTQGHPDRVSKTTVSSEAAMYERIQREPLLAALRPHTVAYFGAVVRCMDVGCGRGPTNADDDERATSDPPVVIELENLLFGCKKPSVMDIKIGAVRHTPQTPVAKIAKIDAKEGPLSAPKQLCLRICGIHYVSRRIDSEETTSEAEPFVVWRSDKDYGRDQNEGEFVEGLARFCSTRAANDAMVRPDLRIVKAFLSAVVALDAALTDEVLATFAFVSTSVLLVHDGAAAGGMHDEVRCAARLIDLARSGPRADHFPEEVIRFRDGIRRLRSMFEGLFETQ